jgi:PLP dependent protein
MDSQSPQDLETITGRISRAARAVGREPASVTLIAVSKTQAAETITPLLAAGHRHFGENRVQEAQAKWPALVEAFPQTHLHLIGSLQSNKAAAAIRLFQTIHTLDRPSLAEALARAIDAAGQTPRLLVQVNIGAEPQKGGVALADLPAFLDVCRERWRLTIDGLMAIPPADLQPAPFFALLAKLAARHGLADLSMGMSADFEQAVRLGATLVRVGSALFGVRD